MLPELKALLRNTLTIERASTTNRDLEESYPTSSQVLGRVERSRQLVVSGGGEDVLHETLIFFDADVTVTEEDRITLPDGQKVIVQRVDTVYDPAGSAHHLEVYVR